ncbi:MAG: Asp23/Gls24 family envelope stress response protein [Clostridia bacterium]
MNVKNKLGNISISTESIASIAGYSATNCFGVKGMTIKSVADGLFHMLKKESQSRGVDVIECEDGGIDIKLHVACQFGVNIHEVCKSIIGEVRYNVEQMTGIDVNNVDIYVETIKTEEIGGA